MEVASLISGELEKPVGCSSTLIASVCSLTMLIQVYSC